MTAAHHQALLVAYGAALLGWLAAASLLPTLWPRQSFTFVHPWGEVGYALLACTAILGIGQLFQRGWLLPSIDRLKVAIDACNQVLIFSPILLLLAWRRQPLASAWLPTQRLWARLLAGGVLGLLAIAVYTTVRAGSDSFQHVVPRVYQPANAYYLIQVLLEDITIAVLFVRFRAAIGAWATIGLVAVLFAAGHIPALLANGAAIGDLGMLVLDAGLGVIVLSVVQRSADVWWFWGVHFALDMMQFHAGV